MYNDTRWMSVKQRRETHTFYLWWSFPAGLPLDHVSLAKDGDVAFRSRSVHGNVSKGQRGLAAAPPSHDSLIAFVHGSARVCMLSHDKVKREGETD